MAQNQLINQNSEKVSHGDSRKAIKCDYNHMLSKDPKFYGSKDSCECCPAHRYNDINLIRLNAENTSAEPIGGDTLLTYFFGDTR